MKTIDTLIKDIYSTLSSKGWFTDELREEFSGEVGRRLQEKFSETTRAPGLRLSKMGPSCPCALWHSVHHPEMAEELPPWAEMKYSYGHILEAWAVTLAKASGHTVTGEQDELIVDGITGHRDCVIDGCLVDVKSTSSISYQKFANKTFAQADTFGYLDQLDGYLVGSADDPLVTVKDRAYLLAIDKQLGHMCLYEHRLREDSIRERIKHHKLIVERADAPSCECRSVESGKSGNLKLDTRASYNPFKHSCKPHLRTFLYAGGPEYLTKVVRVPDVPEVDRHGVIVYN